jgi:transcriptional regulator with XRE-family HTH domain
MNVTILRFFSLIADVLVRLRHERGESQVAVAGRAGISDTQLSKYERGQTVPDVSTLLQVLHAYGQHLVIMPTALAETMVERDAVVTAAAQWYALDPDGDRLDDVRVVGELAAAVQRLVAAELRQRSGAHARLVEGGDR